MNRAVLIAFLAATAMTRAQGPAGGDAADPRADLRIRITLKNGSTIHGVAKGGLLNEMLSRGIYGPAEDLTDRRAGVRVWYYQNLDGFLFLSHRSCERVEVLNALSDEESQTLRDAVARIAGTRAAATAARVTRSAPGEVTPDASPDAGSASLDADDRALLAEFPPTDGWSAERYGEIQRRKIVLHIEPSAQEKRFADVYPKWDRARRKSEGEVAADPAPGSRQNPKGVGVGTTGN